MIIQGFIMLSAIASPEQVVRDVFEKQLNHGKLAGIETLIADDYAKVFTASIQPLLSAFPDLHYDIGEVITSGESVAVRWRWKGTFTKPFKNIAPNDAHVENDGMAIFHVKNGKIVDGTSVTDRLGFLVAAGAVSASSIPR
jgi:predicted ester cyclase